MSYQILTLDQALKRNLLASIQTSDNLVLEGQFYLKKLNYLLFKDATKSVECNLLSISKELLEASSVLLISWKLISVKSSNGLRTQPSVRIGGLVGQDDPEKFVLEIKRAMITPPEFDKISFFKFTRDEWKLNPESYIPTILEKPLTTPIAISGSVVSKSSILGSKDSFMFLISLKTPSKTEKIVFKAMAIDNQGLKQLNGYFLSILPDQIWTFGGLKKKKVKMEQAGADFEILLVFEWQMSSTHPLACAPISTVSDMIELGQLVQASQVLYQSQLTQNQFLMGNSSGHSSQFEDRNAFNETITYEGIITAVFDGSLGLYELDNSVKLHLAHYNFSSIAPYLRNGCEIRLCNVHVILNWQGEIEFLVPCCISTVYIIRYSPESSINAQFSSRDDFKKRYKYFNVLDIIYHSRVSRSLEELIENDLTKALMSSLIQEMQIPEFESLTIDQLIKNSIVQDLVFQESLNILKSLGFKDLEFNHHTAVLGHHERCILTVRRYPQPEILTIKEILSKENTNVNVTVIDCILIATVIADLGGLVIQDHTGAVRAILDDSSKRLVTSNVPLIYCFNAVELISARNDTNTEACIRFSVDKALLLSKVNSLVSNQKPNYLFIPHRVPRPMIEFDSEGNGVLVLILTGKILILDEMKKLDSIVRFEGRGILVGNTLIQGQCYGLRIPSSRISRVHGEVAISWDEKCGILPIDSRDERLKEFVSWNKPVTVSFKSIQDIVAIGLGPDAINLVNLYGQVKSITHCKERVSISTAKMLDSVGAKLTSVIITLKCNISQKEFTVYMRDSFSLYGLIPDSCCYFQDLLLETTYQGRLQGQIIPMTVVTICASLKEGEIQEDRSFVTGYINQVLSADNDDKGECKIICQMLSLLRLEFKLVCLICHSQMVEKECPKCNTQQIYIDARALVSVEDGTAEFTVVMTELQSVLRLLKFRKELIERELIKNQGILRLCQEPWLLEAEKANEQTTTPVFLEACQRPGIMRKIKIRIGKRSCKPKNMFKSKNETHVLNPALLKQKTFKNLIGDIIPTLRSTGIKVYVYEFEEIEIKNEIMALLSNNNSK